MIAFTNIARKATQLLALVAAALAFAAAPIGHAYADVGATIFVNSLADNTTAGNGQCTLREAIANANGDNDTSGGDCNSGYGGLDSIVFQVNGTITVSGSELLISQRLTIYGDGRITISGNNAVRIFNIASGVTVTITDFTIRNGSAGSGGAINNDGNLTITNSTLKDNSSTGTGGGAIYSGGSLTVSNSSFSGNSANLSSGFGGAIRSTGGGSQTTTIVNSTFSGNSAAFGGGLANGGSVVTIINSTFSNSVVYQGGGTINVRISILANSSASNCIRDTTAPGGGGTFNTQHSLIEDAASLASCSNGMNTANLSGDPALGAFTGSPAYFPLNTGSTAINSGNNSLIPVGVTTDQAGNSRILDGTVDMGAAEWVPPLVGITPASASIAEGSNANFTLTRGGSTTAALTVNLSIAPADANMTTADYTLFGTSGQTGSVTVVIPAAASSVAVNFAATADGTSIAEPDNVLTLTVAGGAGYTPDSNSSATATIPANGLGVSNTNDTGEGSLRQAVANANAFASADTINIPAGTYILSSSELGIANNGALTLTGANGAILSGNNAHRVINVYPSAQLTLNKLSIINGSNGGARGGAGILLDDGGVLNVNGSTFSNNSAATYGGGIGAWDSTTVTVVNSTFHNNTAGQGGAIYKSYSPTVSGTMTLINDTVVNNNGGGGVYWQTGTVNIHNSILANNIGGDCVRISGTVNAQNNLIKSGLGCINGTNTANLTGSDPNLGAVTGSPAYFPLNAGSPALNAGNNSLVPGGVTTDQAGNPRIYNVTVDMGAIESNTQFVSLTPASASIAEGSNANFTIARSGSTASALTVQLTITPTNAYMTTADYTLSGGSISGQTGSVTVVIPAAASSVTVNFLAKTDSLAEPDNALTLAVVDAAAYDPAANSSATVTIPANGLGVSHTGDNGEGSLRQAILNANAFPSNDVIPLPAGTITLSTGELGIANNGTVTILGDEFGSSISGNGISRIFHIASNAHANLAYLTITGGAADFGGAVLLEDGGVLNINDSTFTGNLGGAIWIRYSSNATIINSTFHGNYLAAGGTIHQEDSSNLTLINSTVNANQAQIGGGLYLNGSGTTNIYNSIIANNTASISNADCYTGFDRQVNAQNSLIESGLGCVNGVNTANLTGDPNLGALTGNPAYFPPNFGSPVIDSGNNSLLPADVNSDQAGNIRIFNNTVDMGSIESSFAPPTQLSFLQQPSNATGGASISPAITVRTLDEIGNPAYYTGNITLAIGTNPVGGTLSGTTTVAAVAGVATFNGLSINRAGYGYTLAASSTGLSGATSNDFNIIIGAPARLEFGQQPSNTGSTAPITPALTVRFLDAGGNLTTSTANVTLAIGNNPVGGTLSGTTTVAAVAGVATFAGLSINTAGNGYTLTASSTGLSDATSAAFNISVGAPATLAFGQQPTSAAGGAAIAPAPSVRILDAGGNLTASTTNVTLAIGSNPAGGTLSGTTTVAAIAGVATFNGLSINTAGNGYTLAASSTGLSGATSNAFNVSVGAPAQLAFEEQPTDRDSTVPFQPAPTVLILDSGGNLTNSNAPVTLSIGNNPAGGTLSGTTTVLAVGGRATFVGVSINAAGSGYTLAANSAGLSGTLSSPFNITVGTATQLVFGQQPTSSAGGATMAPAVTVRTLDAGGNQTTVPRTVTLAFGNNPSGGTLSGTTSVTTVGGVATFSGLSINNAGTGYTLAASSTGLGGATSNAFNITVGAAAQLAFVQQPGNTTNGTAIVPAPSVRILDAGGNPTTSTANVTLAIGSNPAGGTLSGTTTVAAVAGVATFSGWSINTAGTGYTLAASGSGLSGATSNAFNITGAAALSIDDVTITEGSVGSSDAVFTVSRSNNQTAFSVPYSVTSGTAQAVSDYAATSGTLNFAVGGALTQTISVPVIGDLIVETSETATLNLGVVSNTSGVTTLTDGSGLLTITDTDSAVVSFSPASVIQPESNTPMAFTVTLSNPVQSGVTLAVNSSFGTATAADFTPIVGSSVSFAANSNSSQTVNVAINNDALDEDDESFTLTLSGLSASGNVTLGAATATGTIQDDDQTPTLTISSPSQPEGNSGSSPMNFVVSLSAVSGRDVSFTRATADGTATVANNDYIGLAAAAASIPAGQTSLSIPVAINGDTTYEGDEGFTLNLSAISNATPASLTGTGTIQDDDQQTTSLAITSHTPNPSVVGQPYTVNVTVTGQSTSPAGTVIIRDGGAGSPSCGPVTLVAAAAPTSSASCALTSTSAGAKTLTAEYTPASSAFAASSNTTAHQVNAASTAISVVGPVRSRINQPTSFTFALSVNAPGAGTPSGTVTLSSGAASCTATLPATSCSLSFGALGSRTVSASYAGDSNFGAAASGGAGNAQTLVYASSDLAISNSDAVSVYRPGDLLVYSIVVSNAGPDAAANIRVVDTVPANLSSVLWTCAASGGGVCPVANGSGNLDLTLASMPVGALISITLSGIAGGAPTITNTASIVLPADTTVEDPVLGNNSASDTDLIDTVFASGFEGP